MRQPIRVLQVFHGMDCGGAENMIMNLYRRIERNKIQFDFLVHTDKECFFDEEIRSLGGNIYAVPYFYGINIHEYKNALKTFFSDHPEISIVHGHLGSCAHLYLSLAKKNGCYTIAHSHSTKPIFSIKNSIYRFYTLLTRHIADFFIGCGEEAGEYRFGKKITTNPSKYCIIKNAIDTDSFVFNMGLRKSVRDEFIIGDEVLLGHVGRFSYVKNHVFLLDILKVLVNRIPNMKLMMIGDGELKLKVSKLTDSLGLTNNVIFTGIRKDVSRLLQGMDCFVFPSYYEGLPVTLIEAQAAGLPCVISDKISREVKITELVDYASVDDSAEIWAEIILRSIKTPRSDKKQDLINAGYDVQTTSKWIESFYISRVN